MKKKYINIFFEENEKEFQYLLDLEQENINLSRFVRQLITKSMNENEND